MKKPSRPPRIQYIEFLGDPKNDSECYKRYTSGESFKPVGLGEEVVAFIEKFAYDELAAEFNHTVETAKALRDLCSKVQPEIEERDHKIEVLEKRVKSLTARLANYEAVGIEPSEDVLLTECRGCGKEYARPFPKHCTNCGVAL